MNTNERERMERESRVRKAMRGNARPVALTRLRNVVESVDDDGTEHVTRISDAGFVATVKGDAANRQRFFRFVRRHELIAVPVEGDAADAFTVTGSPEALGELWDMECLASRSFAMSARVPFVAGGSGTLSESAERRMKEYMRPMDSGFQRKADFQAIKDERKRLNRIPEHKEASPYHAETLAVRVAREEHEELRDAGADIRMAEDMEAALQRAAGVKAIGFLETAIEGGLLPTMEGEQRNAMLAVLTAWYRANHIAPGSLETLASFAASL